MHCAANAAVPRASTPASLPTADEGEAEFEEPARRFRIGSQNPRRLSRGANPPSRGRDGRLHNRMIGIAEMPQVRRQVARPDEDPVDAVYRRVASISLTAAAVSTCNSTQISSCAVA